MHAILIAMLDGATWVADTLDTLLDDAVIGFGAAAPFAARGEDESMEPVPPRP
ncbi:MULTISPECIES: hypothetical protein [unclassified Methylobacterium]|uniref:hypothetical protein n=1 Tax=unclassified Methylobacterium TaxID=2615210 RepID=UPI00164F74A6|nr:MULTISPECIES: hypothetical protein [unclassified Methylobacterium]